MMRTLIVDGDGTILDFSGGFIRSISLKLGITTQSFEPTKFDFTDLFGSSFNAKKHITDHLLDPSFLKSIKAYPNALESLLLVKKSGRFDRIVFVSSCDVGGVAKSVRSSQTHTLFPGIFDEVIILDINTNKLQFAAEKYKNESLSIIDDNLSVLCNPGITGVNSYLLDRAYNRGVCPAPVQRINIISEVLNFP